LETPPKSEETIRENMENRIEYGSRNVHRYKDQNRAWLQARAVDKLAQVGHPVPFPQRMSDFRTVSIAFTRSKRNNQRGSPRRSMNARGAENTPIKWGYELAGSRKRDR